jgi:membrane-bound ClpP family serine protease
VFLMILIMAFPLIGITLFFVLPLKISLPVYIFGTAVSIFYHRVMMRSQKLRVVTGHRGMIGRTATVMSWQSDHGTVRCLSEVWNARMEDGGSAAPGSQTLVVGVERLHLVLRPLGSGAQGSGEDKSGPTN